MSLQSDINPFTAKGEFDKTRNLLNPELPSESKGVTTQTKALDVYFLMVVVTLLVNGVHVFAIFMCNFDRQTWQGKG